LAKGAALDLAADAITVNVVCPGPTETGMTTGIKQVPEVYESRVGPFLFSAGAEPKKWQQLLFFWPHRRQVL
jgi:NAD(P)-dependent dehydrogenase (short-subunit alcohol dehydrogenase family)